MEDNSRLNVKPAVDRVKEMIQSVSGVGGPSYTTESNSGYVNPAVQQPAGSITTNPVTTDSNPGQTSEPYLTDRTCSCACAIEEFCRG